MGIIACHPCSAAVTCDCGSPTLILCLSSQQTNSMITYMYFNRILSQVSIKQHSGSMGDFFCIASAALAFLLQAYQCSTGLYVKKVMQGLIVDTLTELKRGDASVPILPVPSPSVVTSDHESVVTITGAHMQATAITVDNTVFTQGSTASDPVITVSVSVPISCSVPNSNSQLKDIL